MVVHRYSFPTLDDRDGRIRFSCRASDAASPAGAGLAGAKHIRRYGALHIGHHRAARICTYRTGLLSCCWGDGRMSVSGGDLGLWRSIRRRLGRRDGRSGSSRGRCFRRSVRFHLPRGLPARGGRRAGQRHQAQGNQPHCGGQKGEFQGIAAARHNKIPLWHRHIRRANYAPVYTMRQSLPNSRPRRPLAGHAAQRFRQLRFHAGHGGRLAGTGRIRRHRRAGGGSEGDYLPGKCASGRAAGAALCRPRPIPGARPPGGFPTEIFVSVGVRAPLAGKHSDLTTPPRAVTVGFMRVLNSAKPVSITPTAMLSPWYPALYHALAP